MMIIVIHLIITIILMIRFLLLIKLHYLYFFNHYVILTIDVIIVIIPLMDFKSVIPSEFATLFIYLFFWNNFRVVCEIT